MPDDRAPDDRVRREIPARRIPRHDEMRNCRERVLIGLARAMEDRNTFTGLEWIGRERRAITEAANAWATAHGLPTITVDQVEAVEHMAVGHVDYAEKLALYVSELVYGLRVQP
jgi:hypothetical protein